MKEAKTKQRSIQSNQAETWVSFLQRRVMRLLFLHDPQLFRGQFRVLYVGSSLASHPLLQFYDRYMKLLTLSEEVLDDILPRIHLQWSQMTEQTITKKADPIEGQIDWQRTIEQASNETPGQLPLRFAMRQRQQSILPENVLTVAILLHHRQFVDDTLHLDQQEEILPNQEHKILINIKDHLDRELAKPHIRVLLEEAQTRTLDTLVEQVKIHLHPGSSPYRDLLDWWEHFSALQIGSSTTSSRLSLSPTYLHKEQMNFWLYELWIALELITLLQEQNALESDTLSIIIDQFSFTFTWKSRRYRFRFQRRGMTGAAVTHHWDQIPAIQSSYLIERENPLIVAYKGKQTWQEPPVVVDVVYSADIGEAMQRLLGNISISATEIGLLLSPYLADPQQDTQMSGEVQYQQARYNNRLQEVRVRLYKITPDMPAAQLQERLVAILQHIVRDLPERQQPVCCGMVLDQGSSNASGSVMQEYDVFCPKPHIGPDVYDLVSRERHCLQDPRLCHVIGQVIIPPQVKRVVSLSDLKMNIEQLRGYGEAVLKKAEEENDEERAEQFQHLILQRVGESIEHYVRTRGNTTSEEKFLREGIFKTYWDQHTSCLEQETRNILISGEYVWDEYQNTQLHDWAAPAVQYCRALEREIKRRFYTPLQHEYNIKEKTWTLGSIKKMYNNGTPGRTGQDWQAFIKRASTFHITEEMLIQQFVKPMVIEQEVSDLRNQLAHGQHIDKETAERLRNAVLGVSGYSLLHWMVRNIAP